MKKLTAFRSFMLSGLVLSLAACGNLSKVSDEGTTDNPVFPKISDSMFNQEGGQFGSWPNWQNVRQIERGMTKEQLYELIGRPHFDEGLYGVREWDYAFNYREDGMHKICQYKILFDKNMQAQSFFWHPNGCNGNASYNLTSDFLFEFDQDTLTVKGLEMVDNVAAQLIASSVQQIKVEGHTDRLGTIPYNLDLSQRRANVVKERLQQQGVTAPIEAIGYGKTHQVKVCEGENGASLKACLSPNRRVVISANGGMLKQQPSNDGSISIGPAPLYQTPAYDGNK